MLFSFNCGKIVEGEPPEAPIAKGAAGPGLLAHILVSKYADALPIYRQSAIYARQDIDLPRSTMTGWVSKMADLLAPLAARIERHVLEGDAIHTDDTVVPVQAPGLKRTKKGRIWAHVRDERPWGSAIPPAAFYKYSPDRRGEHPQSHLKDYEGFLHVDGFSGYDKLFARGKAKEVGCLAHIRRKFFDIYEATCSPLAEKALKWIAELYRIEREINARPPDVRRAVRQKKARPIFDALYEWLAATRPTLPKGQPLAKAMSYAITQLAKLRTYLSDGRLAIGRVDIWRGDGRVRGVAVFRLAFAVLPGASIRTRCSVSRCRSSNRTCGFPASGFHLRSNLRARQVLPVRGKTVEAERLMQIYLRERFEAATAFSRAPN